MTKINGRLILIRHGQSESNRDGYAAGSLDTNLTVKGVFQAEECGKILEKSNIKFDLVFTSRLKRAYNTTKIILKILCSTHLPIFQSEDLNERYQGAWEGRKVLDLEREYGGKESLRLLKRDFNFKPPAGHDGKEAESFLDVITRVSRFYESNIKPHLERGKTILLVAHSCTLRALLYYLKIFSEDDTKHIDIKNAEPLEYKLE